MTGDARADKPGFPAAVTGPGVAHDKAAIVAVTPVSLFPPLRGVIRPHFPSSEGWWATYKYERERERKVETKRKEKMKTREKKKRWRKNYKGEKRRVTDNKQELKDGEQKQGQRERAIERKKERESALCPAS